MKIKETRKFKKQREKLKAEEELIQLKEAIIKVIKDPLSGKKLKGEFKELRSFKYFSSGQQRRLIYKFEEDHLVLYSFGPREGIYK